MDDDMISVVNQVGVAGGRVEVKRSAPRIKARRMGAYRLSCLGLCDGNVLERIVVRVRSQLNEAKL